MIISIAPWGGGDMNRGRDSVTWPCLGGPARDQCRRNFRRGGKHPSATIRYEVCVEARDCAVSLDAFNLGAISSKSYKNKLGQAEPPLGSSSRPLQMKNPGGMLQGLLLPTTFQSTENVNPSRGVRKMGGTL